MGTELQTVERGRDMAARIIKDLPFIVGDEAIAESRKHMALAFGAASPQLFECSEESIGYAIALSAMSGLYPGGPRPDVWLIPRSGEVNWQISSRGYHRLARRANYDGRPHVVHKHDAFEYDAAVPSLTHTPDVDRVGTWETIRLAYLRLVDPSGKVDFFILRKDQIQKRRDCAQTDNVWGKWPEEQTLKTVWNYAGAREAWPTDAQSRFAMAASDKMESGELVTLHESDGLPLLASDIASPEAVTETPDHLTEPQLNSLRAIAKRCGVNLKQTFAHMEWTLPRGMGQLLASEYSNIETAIRETGIAEGGCGKCGEVSEQSFCSKDCELKAKQR